MLSNITNKFIHNSIVFIDSQVEDYHVLVDSLTDETQWYLLDSNSNGISQIVNALAGKTNLTAIHVISHGDVGKLYLGSSILNQDNIIEYKNQLKSIEQSLIDNGDILLYGCNVAQGDAGQQFIEQLAELTNTDIAASTNLTGAANQGGNWALQASTGNIGTNAISSSFWRLYA